MAGITGRNPYGAYQNPYLPSMNGYQMPGYGGWPGMQTGPQQQLMQPQIMQQPVQGSQLTKPTVHADIIQIENEAAGENEPVDAGTSQMMITKDESAILIKSVLANGETTMDVYRKQPRQAKQPEPEYVTRAEFETRIAEMIRTDRAKEWEQEPDPRRLRVLKPEPEEDEPEYDAPAPKTAPRTRGANGGKRS